METSTGSKFLLSRENKNFFAAVAQSVEHPACNGEVGWVQVPPAAFLGSHRFPHAPKILWFFLSVTSDLVKRVYEHKNKMVDGGVCNLQ